jgi:cardiolipin synthase
MWDSILELLAGKAAEGVEVRVMYDGTCAITSLPFSYPKKLEAMGIRCKMFSPVRPMLSTVQNNRDHRKILVIDGKVGFTGGINLADEYVNRRERFGHWKDTAVMLRGEAVQSLTLMFLEMWNLDEKTPENWVKYCSFREAPAAAGGYVIPYCDSPLDNEMVGEFVYLDILNTAKRYVHMMTPYLILDNETITALCYAAKRGVETIIIMPHIPDKWYAYLLARTYYEELIRAGVQIYEYTPGFIHAKQFTSDDEKAVVGTINLDYRSL